MKASQMVELFYTYSCICEGDLKFYRQSMMDHFSSDEITEFSTFKIPKRQDEWLASRITAKLLMAALLKVDSLRKKDISIQKESTGQPYICIHGQGRIEGRFSLSHSHGKVFCGYTHDPDFIFGLDLEMIEERRSEFIEDYFTPREMENYHLSSASEKDIYNTLVWSAKEATLKAAGRGLSIDTRKVEVIPRAGISEIVNWNTCDVEINDGSVERYKVLWNEMGGFIRTISFTAGTQVNPIRINLE